MLARRKQKQQRDEVEPPTQAPAPAPVIVPAVFVAKQSHASGGASSNVSVCFSDFLFRCYFSLLFISHYFLQSDVEESFEVHSVDGGNHSDDIEWF